MYAVGQPNKDDPAVRAYVVDSWIGKYFARGIATVFPGDDETRPLTSPDARGWGVDSYS